MLNVIPAGQGLLFGSFLYHQDHFHADALKAKWTEAYGESFYFVPTFNPLADYYSIEMGSPEKLVRFFAITSKAFDRERLLSSKLKALDWERESSVDQKRRVNIDTGILTAENFVLATTKNYSHRVFIGANIFADLTYQFHQGALRSFPWTYPDYQDDEKIEFFTWARSYLLTLLTRRGA